MPVSIASPQSPDEQQATTSSLSQRIEARIGLYRDELAKRDDGYMVERHLIFGDAFAINKTQYFELKQEMAKYFNLPVPSIVMVGSGKLGFSINPDHPYKHFGDESDLDIALVGSHLFDEKWKEAYLRRKAYGDWPEESHFFKNIKRGWLRPDLLPERQVYRVRLWDYLRKLDRAENTVLSN